MLVLTVVLVLQVVFVRTVACTPSHLVLSFWLRVNIKTSSCGSCCKTTALCHQQQGGEAKNFWLMSTALTTNLWSLCCWKQFHHILLCVPFRWAFSTHTQTHSHVQYRQRKKKSFECSILISAREKER